MKIILIYDILCIAAVSRQSQKIYVEAYRSQADAVLYETRHRSEAAIIVYRTDYKSEADPEAAFGTT